MLIESFFSSQCLKTIIEMFFQTCNMIKIKMLHDFLYEYIVFHSTNIYKMSLSFCTNQLICSALYLFRFFFAREVNDSGSIHRNRHV